MARSTTAFSKNFRIPPLSTPSFILLICVLVSPLFLIPILFPPSSISFTPTPFLPPLHPLPPDLCLLIGLNPLSPKRQDNSKSLCLVSNVCLEAPPSPALTFLSPRATFCNFLPSTLSAPHLVSASLSVEQSSCASFRETWITRVYGPLNRINRPTPVNLSIVSDDQNPPNKWSSHNHSLVILAPEYPYQRNIFHFANAALYIAYAARNALRLVEQWKNVAEMAHAMVGIDDSKISVVVRGREDDNEWQRGLWTAVKKFMGDQVSVEWLPKEGMCMRRAVMLGNYGDINAWPFVNDSVLDGKSVGIDAVEFRDVVYKQAGLPGVWNGRRLRTPPMVLGYAKRMSGVEGGTNVKNESVSRSFGPEDEEWVDSMLREEAERGGVEYRSWVMGNGETFEKQVERMVEVGVVFGVHGANLVNGMFVRPFGGLVEVFPRGGWSRCYMEGMGSGLRYWSKEMEEGEGERCNLNILECKISMRNRRVVIGDADKEVLRSMVREAVEWLGFVNSAGGRVRFDEGEQRYTVAGVDL